MNRCIALLTLAMVGCSPAREVVQVYKGDPGTNGANGHSLVSQFAELSEESLECANGGTSLNIYIDMDDSLSASEGDVFTNSLVACNGANGLAGLNGTDGTNGVDGTDGAPGLDGRRGRPGRDGRNGTNGKNGKDGAQGLPGEMGPAGPQGPQGEAGEVGPAGPIGQTGSQGSQGAQGPAGPAGPQGPAGTPGATGASGSGATITAYNSSTCILIPGTSFYTKYDDIYSASSCHSNTKVIELDGGSDTFWVSATKLAVENNGNGIRVISFN